MEPAAQGSALLMLPRATRRCQGAAIPGDSRGCESHWEMDRRAAPTFVEPQLAKLVKEAPDGDEWLHELKFDGYRILARLDRGKVTLYSRRGKDWTVQFAPVAAAAAKLAADTALVDGEVAVVLPDGRTSFQALQNAFGGRDTHGLTYFVFDLLHLDGEDLRPRPLEARKARLRELVAASPVGDRIHYSDHVEGRGRAFFATACGRGLEGIISKRRDLPYQTGRGNGWVKTKCVQRQEMVIGGFTDPEGARTGLGAILVGVYDGDDLVYAGKVGTGFDARSLRDLHKRLTALEQKKAPFAVEPPRAWVGGPAHWVRPDLVAEIEFIEWTSDGRLRHPSFKGLRADKRPRDVVREKAAEASDGDGDDEPPPASGKCRAGCARSAAIPGTAGPRCASASPRPPCARSVRPRASVGAGGAGQEVDRLERAGALAPRLRVAGAADHQRRDRAAGGPDHGEQPGRVDGVEAIAEDHRRRQRRHRLEQRGAVVDDQDVVSGAPDSPRQPGAQPTAVDGDHHEGGLEGLHDPIVETRHGAGGLHGMRHTAARGLAPAAMRRPGHFCTAAIASVPDWRGARAAHGTPAA